MDRTERREKGAGRREEGGGSKEEGRRRREEGVAGLRKLKTPNATHNQPVMDSPANNTSKEHLTYETECDCPEWLILKFDKRPGKANSMLSAKQEFN